MFKLQNGRKKICYICEIYERKFELYMQEDIILYNNVLHYIIIIKLWMFVKKLNIYELKKHLNFV